MYMYTDIHGKCQIKKKYLKRLSFETIVNSFLSSSGVFCAHLFPLQMMEHQKGRG